MTEKQLKRWAKIQRSSYGSGSLCPSKRALLERISGWQWKTRQSPRKLSDIISTADELVSKNNGILPSRGWLIKNGHRSIVDAKNSHPGMFKHIKQDRTTKSLDDWVAIAGRLLDKVKGKLPSSSWMETNGYSGLNHAMRDFPDRFTHVSRPGHGHTLNDWHKIAKNLAAKNKGFLYSPKWLQNNDHWGLYCCMRRNPSYFKNIPQKTFIISKRERLPFKEAKRIVQKAGITSQAKFFHWKKMSKPAGIPGSPPIAYAVQWRGWNKFLGTKPHIGRPKSARKRK